MDFLLWDVSPVNFEEQVLSACNTPLDIKGLED